MLQLPNIMLFVSSLRPIVNEGYLSAFGPAQAGGIKVSNLCFFFFFVFSYFCCRYFVDTVLKLG